MARYDDNTYPDCRQCGSCCRLNVLAMTADDYAIVKRFVAERNVRPNDYAKQRCCFQNPDFTCMIWEARPQVCRLHNCHVPRRKILEDNPGIVVDEDLWLVDMHENFVEKG